MLIALLIFSSCKGANPKAPPVDIPRLYTTDSETQQVYRNSKSGMEHYLTSDPRFDEMTCVWNSELKKLQDQLIDISYKCDEWKK